VFGHEPGGLDFAIAQLRVLVDLVAPPDGRRGDTLHPFGDPPVDVLRRRGGGDQ
jgi:hypothetical protein